MKFSINKAAWMLLLAVPAQAARVPKLSPIPIPVAPSRTTLEVNRDNTLAKLAETGAREALEERGYTLWHALRFTRRSGEQVHLTLDIKEGAGNLQELEARLAKDGPELVAMLAAKLEVDVETIMLHARKLKECCGAGCTTCVKSKDGAAQYWVGEPPFRK